MDLLKPRSQGELQMKEDGSNLANDLQGLLINERERGNKHKLNYITLKSNLESAENKIRCLENALREREKDFDEKIENFKGKLESLENENQEKNFSIQKLKCELKHPDEVNLLVLQAKLDTEKSFKDKINTLDSLNKDFQKQIIEWRHKDELHHAEIKNLMVSNEEKVFKLTQSHENQIKLVEECCQKLFQPIAVNDYENMLEELKLENKSLVSQVKNLETCMSDIEKERSHLQQEYDDSRRSWSKQTMLHSNTVEDFKIEILKLKNKIACLEKNDAATNVDKTNIESKLNEAELKNVELQFSLEQCKHKLKIKDSASKIHEAEIKLENKREISSLNKLLSVFRQETNSKDLVIVDLRSKLSLRERELRDAVESYKELTESFSQLNAHYQMLQESQGKQQEVILHENSTAPECLKCMELAELKENETIKVTEQYKLIQSLTCDLETERLESLQSLNSLKSLQKAYETIKDTKGKMEVELANLRQEKNDLRCQLDDSVNQHERSMHGYERTLVDLRVKHSEEIIHLTHRISELESALESKIDLKEKLNISEQKLRTYRKLIRKLRKKLEASKSEESRIHKSSNWKTKCRKLQVKLNKMTCSQKQFHDILMGISVPLKTDILCDDSNKGS